MKMLGRQLSVSLILLCCVQFHVQCSLDEIEGIGELRRSQFPKGFLFGTSTSSYQIEGAPFEDGSGLSNWDFFSHIPGKIANDENGDIADDHYHRYMEDIELMANLGVNVYRFSISWTRILPRGIYGDINPNGIKFYNKLIDNLLRRGIEPFVTIHHHDLPQELEERYGGWLNRRLIEKDFVRFAEICFENFGDRVKYWITINEPNIFANFAYMTGSYPPGHCSEPFGNCNAGNSDIEPLIAVHNMLLSHAKAVQLYRNKFQAKQGGVIGIVPHSFFFEPLTNGKYDRLAVNRAFAFNVQWILDPLVFGDYPPEMHYYLGRILPVFTAEDKKLIKGSVDFIAINHYGTIYVKDCIHSKCSSVGSNRPIRGLLELTGIRNGIPIGEETGVPSFFVVPRGMEKIVDYVKNRYNNMPIYITEGGYASPLNATKTELIEDYRRVHYLQTYLSALLRGIRNGADVRGYMIWSFMDNFEWASGYGPKFGIYYVDRTTQKRIPKLSAKWFYAFLHDNLHTNITQDSINHHPILQPNISQINHAYI